jgi:hypothetical protein
MALSRQLARLAKLIVDSEGIGFETAEARLRALTLEIVVGPDAITSAAHAAVLTAVAVGHRSFVGGVRVIGAHAQPLNTALPLNGATLGDAAKEVGATSFGGAASQKIIVGTVDGGDGGSAVAAWCDGWRAGTSPQAEACWGDGSNPLAGIAAGALAVSVAFDAARGNEGELSRELCLWDTAGAGDPPVFSEVFLPGALWLVGLGNLGQAYLWALAALPYQDPSTVQLVLQDRDKVSEENWGTSVLVHAETYGALKTKVSEGWAEAKGFTVRRIDRRLLASDKLEDGDPRIALSGVDKIEARRLMAKVGFECVVDAGLGRTAHDFDKYRVTVFDDGYQIDKHFAGMEDPPGTIAVPDKEAYRELRERIGGCGAIEIAGASVAVPFVSAVTATIALARLIGIFSGSKVARSDVARMGSLGARRTSAVTRIELRGALHAGRPRGDGQ